MKYRVCFLFLGFSSVRALLVVTCSLRMHDVRRFCRVFFFFSCEDLQKKACVVTCYTFCVCFLVPTPIPAWLACVSHFGYSHLQLDKPCLSLTSPFASLFGAVQPVESMGRDEASYAFQTRRKVDTLWCRKNGRTGKQALRQAENHHDNTIQLMLSQNLSRGWRNIRSRRGWRSVRGSQSGSGLGRCGCGW